MARVWATTASVTGSLKESERDDVMLLIRELVTNAVRHVTYVPGEGTVSAALGVATRLLPDRPLLVFGVRECPTEALDELVREVFVCEQLRRHVLAQHWFGVASPDFRENFDSWHGWFLCSSVRVAGSAGPVPARSISRSAVTIRRGDARWSTALVLQS
jgi:hypothetical protein